MSILKKSLDSLLQTRDPKDSLARDPLSFVHRYTKPQDQEIAAVFAAQLAYGRVSMFFPVIKELLDEADDFGAADKVERIEGTYNGKAFELDRVYSDYNEEDDTYGLIEVEWYDGDSSLTDEELEDTIIERFWDMDYDE